MIRQESEAGCHSVKKMCDFLDVSRATYYRKINFKPSKRHLERDLLDERVLRIYHESDRIYGAGKIHYLLTQKYHDYRKISMKHVQKSMQRQSIQSITIKKFKAGKSSKKVLENYKNLLNQDFSTTGLNQKWVADITYIQMLENGWCYLSTVMDLHSRKIIGYHFNKKMETDIVINALEDAVLNRKLPTNYILHTDLGSQYTSAE